MQGYQLSKQTLDLSVTSEIQYTYIFIVIDENVLLETKDLNHKSVGKIEELLFLFALICCYKRGTFNILSLYQLKAS